MNTSVFLAGAAREDTTPPVGTLMYGYTPHQESTSVHDNLAVTVLAVSQYGKTVLMLTCAIGDIQTELCNKTAGKIAEVCGVPQSHILISSTHTHSAPNLSGVIGWGELNMEYYDGIFLPAVLSACKKHWKTLRLPRLR